MKRLGHDKEHIATSCVSLATRALGQRSPNGERPWVPALNNTTALGGQSGGSSDEQFYGQTFAKRGQNAA
eukprot:11162140-Lingulodinium_polyedra.AAC.1